MPYQPYYTVRAPRNPKFKAISGVFPLPRGVVAPPKTYPTVTNYSSTVDSGGFRFFFFDGLPSSSITYNFTITNESQTLIAFVALGSGGGGGSYIGGGGGAGGFGSELDNMSRTFSVVIDPPGQGATGTGTNNGGDGGATVFTLVSSPGPFVILNSLGGGGGGGGNSGQNGGCGGGAAGTSVVFTGGIGSQGFDGGDNSQLDFSGAGGGGTYSAGDDVGLSITNNGGNGIDTYPFTQGGGGGGGLGGPGRAAGGSPGAGGLGGGGNGGDAVPNSGHGGKNASDWGSGGGGGGDDGTLNSTGLCSGGNGSPGRLIVYFQL